MILYITLFTKNTVRELNTHVRTAWVYGIVLVLYRCQATVACVRVT